MSEYTDSEILGEENDFINNDDTDYLMSLPEMTDKIKDGMNTPLSECVPLDEVWDDV